MTYVTSDIDELINWYNRFFLSILFGVTIVCVLSY